MNPKIDKLAVDGAIAVVFALLVLLYVFLLLGEIVSALIAFFIAIAISLGALLAVGRPSSPQNRNTLPQCLRFSFCQISPVATAVTNPT